ncbi:MAG TPA: DUF2807 domain-containing protein, partial [Burkholderiaceae bacterium]|nr:DUF2807 domain-containing protein [Burkholderiaceae bacterium]
MQLLLKIGAVMLLLAAVLVGTSFGIMRAQDVGNHTGNGSHALKSEVRKVGADVVNIEVNGPIELMLTQGANPGMVVVGEERLLSRVQATQKGTTLSIDMDNTNFFHTRFNHALRVELTLPALQQLTFYGSGDGIVSGFSGDKLTIALHGSGDVRFNGDYQHVNASTLGSGDLDLALGNNSDLDLHMMGSGSVTTSGHSKALSAHIMGSGDLGAEKLMADSVKIDVMGSGNSDVYAKQVAILDVKGSGDI